MISFTIFTVFLSFGFSLAVTKTRNMSENILCFGFIFLELGIKQSEEHKKVTITLKLLNIHLNLPNHALRWNHFLEKPKMKSWLF